MVAPVQERGGRKRTALPDALHSQGQTLPAPHRTNSACGWKGQGPGMIKSELIAKLAEENPHLTQRDIERVVGVILERMIQALEEGGRVELRGFGALSVRSRDARAGRNPRTGEPVDVRAKHVPFFKSGKELRERLNATDE